MSRTSKEIREWAGNHFENEAKEILEELDENEDLVEQARNEAVEATKNFYINLISSNTFVSEERAADMVETKTDIKRNIEEVASNHETDQIAKNQGDVYRTTTQEYLTELREELEIEIKEEDIPARKKYSDHIDHMVQVAEEQSIEAAKDPQVFYESIKKVHPTEEDFRRFINQREQESAEEIRRAVEAGLEDSESMEEVLDTYEEQMKYASSIIMDPFCDVLVERIYESGEA